MLVVCHLTTAHRPEAPVVRLEEPGTAVPLWGGMWRSRPAPRCGPGCSGGQGEGRDQESVLGMAPSTCPLRREKKASLPCVECPQRFVSDVIVILLPLEPESYSCYSSYC